MWAVLGAPTIWQTARQAMMELRQSLEQTSLLRLDDLRWPRRGAFDLAIGLMLLIWASGFLFDGQRIWFSLLSLLCGSAMVIPARTIMRMCAGRLNDQLGPILRDARCFVTGTYLTGIGIYGWWVAATVIGEVISGGMIPLGLFLLCSTTLDALHDD